MRRLWCVFLGLFLVGTFSFCSVGCGPAAEEVTESVEETEDDLSEQEEMMDEMEEE